MASMEFEDNRNKETVGYEGFHSNGLQSTSSSTSSFSTNEDTLARVFRFSFLHNQGRTEVLNSDDDGGTVSSTPPNDNSVLVFTPPTQMTIKTLKGDQSYSIEGGVYAGYECKIGNSNISGLLCRETIEHQRSSSLVMVDAGGGASSSLLSNQLSPEKAENLGSYEGILTETTSMILANIPKNATLYLSAFEIYQEKITDLISGKNIQTTHAKSSTKSNGVTDTLSGIQSVTIASKDELFGCLLKILPSSRIGHFQKRSHIFFRLTLSFDSAHNSQQNGAASRDVNILFALLASFDSTQKEFLSQEQNDIKKSLFSLGLMIDIMNGETTSIGFHWKSYKLTATLHHSFAHPNLLLISSHSFGLKDSLPAAIWSINFLNSCKKLEAKKQKSRLKSVSSVPMASSSPIHSPIAPKLASSHNLKRPSPQTSSTNVLKPNAPVAKQGTLAQPGYMEPAKLRADLLQSRAFAEEELKKERNKCISYQRRLREAQQTIVQKEMEINSLNRAVMTIKEENTNSITNLDRVVKERTDYYKNKLLEQEELFKRQNLSLQLVEQKLNDFIHQLKSKGLVSMENQAAPSQEETQLLIHLQSLIMSQIEELTEFHRILSTNPSTPP